jgi:hypothetical protein
MRKRVKHNRIQIDPLPAFPTWSGLSALIKCRIITNSKSSADISGFQRYHPVLAGSTSVLNEKYNESALIKNILVFIEFLSQFSVLDDAATI